ncbi:hypothetical protein GHT06_003715 [Daphnia sinensis]|uniref:Cadherin domain-containing protein n=1 Tax=Daphnia sinensis TaxID=1820382 RepID=A0AAD5KDK8_9CRUS|nr:hypothetical protein GHT06_003715 [Daphnia sinensis]
MSLLAPNTNLSALTDGIGGTTAAMQFVTTPAQNQLNKELIKIQFYQATQLDAIYIQKTTATQIFGGNVMVQGSNDNLNWTNLQTAAGNPANGTNITANGAVSLTNSNKFTINANAAAFRYYRIFGTVSANVLAGIASEVYFDVNVPSYQATFALQSSFNLCIDNDGDGLPDLIDPISNDLTTPNCVGPAIEIADMNIRQVYRSAFGIETATTPTVADLDNDGIAEILVKTGTGIIIYKGDGSNFSKTTNNITIPMLKQVGNSTMQPAVADINRDGNPEIAVIDANGFLYLFPNTVLTSPGSTSTPSSYIAKSDLPALRPSASPNFVDFDEDGISEIYVGTDIFKFDPLTNTLTRVISNGLSMPFGGGLAYAHADAVAADIILSNPGKELAAGGTVYAPNFTTNQLTVLRRANTFLSTIATNDDGRTGIADVDLDGDIDVFYGSSSTGAFVVWDPNGGSVLLRRTGGTSTSGMPMAANLYNDTRDGKQKDFPEILVVNTGQLIAYNVNYKTNATPGVIWQITIDDGQGAAETSVTSFDFEGDGVEEILFLGERQLSIINASKLPVVVKASFDIATATWAEHPVVADVNGDGTAEIVAVAGDIGVDIPFTGYVYVLESGSLPWQNNIDDDNDGVLDAVESPACFYTATEWNQINKSSFVDVTSELLMVTSNLNQLNDGLSAAAVQFSTTPAQNQSNKELFKFNFGLPVQLDAIYIQKTTATQIFGGNVMLQGSNNNTQWVNLQTAAGNPTNATNITANGSISLVNSNKFTINTNAAPYKFYRILGAASANVLSGVASEIFYDINLPSYQASLFPTLICTNDIDNDGKLNHLDLDSDGDGCADAIEAGSSITATSTTVFATTSGTTDTNGNGLLNVYEGTVAGTVNYSSTYSNYALVNNINACLDTDGDGVTNVFDLDDDNDGILDIDEMDTCSGIVPYILENINGTSTGAAGYNSAFPSWMLSSFAEIQPGYRLKFDTPVEEVVLQFASIFIDDKIGDFSVKLSDGTIINAVDFDVSTSDAATANIWTPQPNGVNNFNDSDGDGCSDAIEAASSTTATSTSVFSTGTDTNRNGLLNVYEGTVAGTVNYTSTYTAYALSNQVDACLDTDGDSLTDVSDLDDDNDGILDTDEMCSLKIPLVADGSFELLANVASFNAFNSNVTSAGWIDGTGTADSWNSPMPTTGTGQWGGMADGTPSSPDGGVFAGGWVGKVAPNSTGESFYTTVTDLIVGNKYTLKFYQTAAGVEGITPIGANSRWQINIGSTILFSEERAYEGEGNQTWTETKLEFTAQSTSQKIEFFINNGLDGQSTVSLVECMAIDGIRLYKGGIYDICALDTDNDGIPNHLDLDSDADGCSDAIEAGSSTTATSTSVYPTGTDTNGNGLLNNYEGAVAGTINYTSNYEPFAISANLASCRDSDNDGIFDLDDVDDDNDGVLDAIESPTCFFTSTEWNTSDKSFFAQISSQLNTLSPNSNFTKLTDGIGGTVAAVQFSTTVAQAQLNKELFKITLLRPTRLDAIYIKKTSATQIFAATAASLRVQGSNDNTAWTDLTAAIASPVDATNITANGAVSLTNSNKFTLTLNLGEYKYYRIYGVAAANILAGIASEFYFDVHTPTYQASLYTKPTCTNDLDDDEAFNHIDLDTDGDGCSDAYEAGLTSITTPNFSFSGAVGTNGLLNTLETSVDNGIPNYISTYSYFPNAISNNLALCKDLDGDGIFDQEDLDDDNDGILDEVESPSCFYTKNDWYMGNRSEITVTTELAMEAANSAPFKLVDGLNLGGSGAVRFLGSTAAAKQVYAFNMNIPVQLNKIILSYTSTATHFLAGTNIVLRGSNDGVIWTDLSVPTVYSNTTATNGVTTIPPFVGVNNANVFTVTQNAAKYKHYAIYWTSGGGINASGGVANEVHFETAATYNPSAHPKLICSNDDDNDGILNHQDLDSDGDGCFDAIEANIDATTTTGMVAGSFGSNGFSDGLETQTESGIYSGSYTYGIARDLNISACLDSDNDGVRDVFDLDDDNDGILDEVECPTPGFESILPRFQINEGASRTQIISGFPEELYIDIWNIDNNFNLKINNVDITTVSELNLSNMGTTVYTASNTLLVLPNGAVVNAPNHVWTYGNAQPRPLLRVRINRFGETKIFALDGTQGAGNYQELVLLNASYQLLPINLTGTNTITLGQNNQFSPSYLFAEFNAFNGSGACDTDGDGIRNSLDLDSDNDGCSDAYESGTTAIKTADYVFTTGFGTNGFANSLEGQADNGIYNGVYTYELATTVDINVCLDFDNDGISDIYDIDDDNDGILDAIESPSCFNNFTELSQFESGSKDDIVWTDLSGPLSSTATTGSFILPNTLQPAQSFKYFRIIGVAGTGSNGGVANATLLLHASTNTSLFPKITCLDDIDGDNIPNHLDLDSDADGCADAIEAGTAPARTASFSAASFFDNTTTGANGFRDALETSPESGVYKGLYSYQFAIDKNIDGCLDSDGDGVPNLIDIDDDNDGILDVSEQTSCGSLVTLTPTSATSSPVYGGSTATRTIDSSGFTGSGLNALATAPATLDDAWLLREPETSGFIDGWYDINNNSIGQISTEGQTVSVAYNMFLSEFRAICGVADIDTDNDGIPNRLDLDSDGDGCADAIEGASSTTATSSTIYPTGTDTNGNGLLNVYEDITAGKINYVSTYSSYALTSTLNVCADTDGDGINDIFDLDDDNDGILDAVESPNCFYTANELQRPIAVSTQLPMYSNYLIANTIDNNPATASAFGPNINWVGLELFKLTAGSSIKITGVTLGNLVSWPLTNGTASFKLQGSVDNITWTDLSAAVTSTAASNDFVISNTIEPTKSFIHYRIIGVSGLSWYGGVGEIRFNIAADFNSSANPKPICTNDTDGDQKLNHQDLDSDGDGCADAIESGSSTTATSTSVFPTGDDLNNNGLLDIYEGTIAGTVKFNSTYDFALSAAFNLCLDSDNDGVVDYFDLDDDNDGVLDNVESPACFYTNQELQVPIAVSSELTQYNTSYVIGNSIDASASTASAFAVGQNWVGKEIFKFTAVDYVPLSAMTFDLVSWALSANATSTFKLQGSSDNASWTDLSVAITSSATSGTLTINNTLATSAKFKFFRLIGVAGTSGYGGVHTARFVIPDSPNQFYQKPNCNSDNDNDDLDSDGDSCSDAVEAGTALIGSTAFSATSFFDPTKTGTNGFADALETTAGSGIYKGTYTYLFATINLINTCLDTDGDGVGDIIDIDDDNDGAPDLQELSCVAAVENGTCTIAQMGTLQYGITSHCTGWIGFDYDPSPSVTVITNFDYMGLTNGIAYFDFQGSVGSSATTAVAGKMYKNYATVPGVTYTYTINLMNNFVDAEGIKPQLKGVDFATGLELGATYLNGTGTRSVTFTAIGTTTSISVGFDTRPSIAYVGPNQFWHEVSSEVSWTFGNGASSLNALVDGIDGSTNQAYPNASMSGKTALQFDLPQAKMLTLIELGNHPGQIPFVPGGTYKIQGWNGSTWTDIVASQTVANSQPIYASNNSIKFSMPANTKAYIKYRIFGISLTNQGNWAQELYFQEYACTDIDTDGDGIPNRLDLDSDGDSCADAIEAGSSTTATSTTVYPTGEDTNENGLMNVYEGTTAGTINYTSTYANYALSNAINACLDTDGDGIGDVIDIDDDNDGVLDVAECVNSNTQLFLENFQTATVNPYKSSPIYQPGISLNGQLVTGGANGTSKTLFHNTGSGTYRAGDIFWGTLTPISVVPNSTYEISYFMRDVNGVSLPIVETWLPISLSFKVPATAGYAMFGLIPAGNTQTPNDWVDGGYKFYPQNTTVFGYFGAAWDFNDPLLPSDVWSIDISATGYVTVKKNSTVRKAYQGVVSDYKVVVSAYAASSFTDIMLTDGPDTNGNGLLNVYEGTAVGTVNYTSTYVDYALARTINACTDTDGDGVPDIIDLDDDNDGILDTDEYGPFGCLSAPSCIVNPSFSATANSTGTPPTGWNNFPNGGSMDISQGNWKNSYGQVTPTSTLFPNTPASTYFIYGMSKNGSGSQGGWAPFGESFQQTLNCLTVGKTYYITFRGAFTSVPGNFGLSWATAPSTARFVLIRDGVQVSQASDQNLHAAQQTVSLSFTATSTSHTVAIAHTNNGANDISLMVIEAGSGFFCADAIPANNTNLDTDNDGIPNHLDLDSDNDGCSDANEAYNNTTAQGTDGNLYYGTGNPPAVNANGTVIGASYPGTNAAVTSVGSASTITAQPINQTVQVTQNAVFTATVTAGSGTTSYQWQISTDGGATWNNVSNTGAYSGANTTNLTVASVSSAMQGHRFRLNISQSNYVCGNRSTDIARLILGFIPTIVDDSFAAVEDTPITASVFSNDSGSAGSPLTLTSFSINGTSYNAGDLATITGVGTIIVNANGTFTFTPDLNYNGAIPSIDYTAKDANNGTDSGTLSLTLTPVNDAPTVGSVVESTPQNTAVSGNVLTGNSIDTEGNTLSLSTFTIDGTTYNVGQTATIPGIGTLVMNADGSYTFTPVLGYVGAVPVATFTLSDGNGGTATNSLTLSIINVNDAPLVVDDSLTGAEDAPITGNVLTNDSDVDGDAIKVTQFVVGGITVPVDPANGGSTSIANVGTIIMNADGTFTFTPLANYNGTVPAITYTLSDGTATDTGSLNLTVTAINDAPLAVDDVVNATEDTPLTGNVLTNDGDVDLNTTLTVSTFTINGVSYNSGTTASIPGVGTVEVKADGPYTFTPALNYNGAVPDITYAITDGNGGTDTGLLDITLIAVDDAPLAINDSFTGAEDAPITGNLISNDSDVEAVNDAPVAVDDVVNAAEDTSLTGNVLTNDTDVDGNTLLVSQFKIGTTSYNVGDLASIPGVGTIVVNANGEFTFIPALNYNGNVPDIFYTISDGNGGSSTALIDITVAAVNDAPLAADDISTTNAAQNVSANVLTNDSDLESNTLSVTQFTVAGITDIFTASTSPVTIPGVGTFSMNTNGVFIFVPSEDVNGDGTIGDNFSGDVPIITYTISDGNGGTDTATLDIYVAPVNRDPFAVNDTKSLDEDNILVDNVISNDSDLDLNTIIEVTQFTFTANTITYTYPAGTLATIPWVGTIQLNANGGYSFTPNSNWNGAVPDISYTLSDNDGGLAIAILGITVTAVNDDPVAVNDDNIVSPEDSPVLGNVLLNDSDPDGNPVLVKEFTIAGITGVGTLVIEANGDFTFTPELNYSGSLPTITYIATDNSNTPATDAATLNIAISPLNDNPVAQQDTNTLDEDDANKTGNLLTNDSDIDSNPLIISQFNINGAVYNPVNPVNDAPVASNDSQTGLEESTLTGNVLTNDSDIDGENLSVTSFEVNGQTITIPTGTSGTAVIANAGSITVNFDGTYNFTPEPNYNGTVPAITYTVSDGIASATAKLNLSIMAVNDNPVPTADSKAINEDAKATGNVLANDSDVETANADLKVTEFSFTIGTTTSTFPTGTTATIAGVGTILVNANGTYEFTPNGNYNGTVPAINYILTDEIGATATSSLTISITPVNDAPAAVNDSKTGLEDADLTGTVLTNDSDTDGGTLSVTSFEVNGQNAIAIAPGGSGTTTIANVGSISVNSDGTYNFTPLANYNGSIPAITYTLSDGQGGSSTATLNLSITAINDNPIAQNDINSGNEGSIVSGTVLTNDSDLENKTLSVSQFAIAGVTYSTGSIAEIPNVGTLILNSNGTYSFSPEPNYAGDVPVVTYTLSDGQTVSLAGIGMLVVNADGTFTFTPLPNYHGIVPLIGYNVTDGNTTVPGSLNLTVNSVNDLPALQNETIATPQNTVATGNVLTNETDVDGDVLTITEFSIDTNGDGNAETFTAGSTATIVGKGTLVINTDGSFTFTPATNYYGAVPIATYQLTDGTVTVNAALNLTVSPVDTDGDGVMDFQELLDSTDPDDPCSFNIDNQDITPSTAWSNADCDGDGTTNGQEVINNTDPLDPCAHAPGAIPDTSNPIWLAADCDGDGETNETEATNNTDPNDPCSYAVAPLSGSTAYTQWSALDCDGDGINNATEILYGTDPKDLCDYLVANLDLDKVHDNWSNADCDNDGLTNGEEATGFDDPNTIANPDGKITNPLLADTDGDGVSDYQEALDGTDPTDGCDYNPENQVAANVSTAWKSADCDSDGLNNGEELTGVDDPATTTNPNGEITNPLNADSDGDGVSDRQEAIDGTDPNDVCDYNVSNQVLANVSSSWSNADCDNDGLTNGEEATGVDNPNTVANPDGKITNPLLSDTDGDGVSDAQEALDGTNPVSYCDYNLDSQDITKVSDNWNSLDCDNDGESNGTELSNNTDPQSACSYITAPAAGITAYTTWSAIDCDGDGVNNGVEITNNTDPLNPDSDGDGNPDNTDPNPTIPTATNDTTNVSLGTSVVVDILANDDFLPNDGNTIVQAGGTASGTVSFNSLTGEMSYSPALTDAGNSVTVVYQVCQGIVCGTATVTIAVAAVNNAPVAVDDLVTTLEDTPVSGNVLSNDTDVDGDDLTVTGYSIAGVTGPFTLAITVTAVNDAPVATDDIISSPEDTPVSGNVLTNDTDVDGNTLTVSGYSIVGITGSFTIGTLETIPNIGTILVDYDGTFAFTQVENYNGTVPVITYMVSDGNGGTDTEDLAITVTAVNDAPVASDDVVTTPEDSPVSGNVLTNDTDVEGNILTVSGYRIAGLTGSFTLGMVETIPSIGTIVVNADGSFTFTPEANYNGTVPVITYTVSDGSGGTDMGDLAITVTSVNDMPVAVDDVISSPEDSPVSGNILSNDTDVDANTLLIVTEFEIVGVSGTFVAGQQTATIPNVGTIIVNAVGTFTFTPVENYNGTVPVITYTVSDLNGGTDMGDLTITVTSVNDVPVALDDVVTTPEDSPVSGNVLTNDTDADGNTLTVSGYSIVGITGSFTIGTLETIPNVGTIILNADGTFTFTPEANYNGTVPVITYTVSDGNGGTDTGDLSITWMMFFGKFLTNDTDADGNTLTVSGYSIAGSTGSFTIGTPATIPSIGTIVVNADGTFTFTPIANFNGTVPVITYMVSDGNGGTDTGDLVITVTAVNDAPVAVNDIISSSGDSPVSGNVLTNDTDVEGNTLTVSGYSIVGITGPFTIGTTETIPSIGTIVVNADGTFTFTPVANFNGTVPVITYMVSDGNGGTDTGDLAITVTAVNDVPVALDDVVTTPEDSPVSGNVLTNDTDVEGNTLTVSGYSIVGITGPFTIGTPATIPSIGTIVVNADGSFIFTPVANYNGTVPVITYTVSDGNGGTDTGDLAITVTAVNDAPVAVDDIISSPEDSPVSGNVLTNDTDVEGNTLTVSGYSIAGLTGSFTIGTPATILGIGTIVVNADGSFTFTPESNYNDNVPVITYTVGDGNGGMDSGDLTITVTSVNDVPVAVDDIISSSGDSPVSGNVLTNDTDVEGNTLTVSGYSIVGITGPFTIGTTETIPSIGTIVVNADGTFTFTPVANFNGTVPVITYMVSDGNGGTDTGDLAITVTAVNDVPVALDDVVTTPEDSPVSGNVLTNDKDVDGNTLTVSGYSIAGVTGPFTLGTVETIPNVGTIVVNADGTFTFTPEANYNGTVPVITYTVSDENGGTDTGDLAITVTAVNDAPVAVDDIISSPEDSPVSGNVLTNDTDVEGNTLTVSGYSIAGSTGPFTIGTTETIPNIGTIVVNADGIFTFRPVEDYNGTVPVITYTWNGYGELLITVTAVNDAPVGVDDIISSPEDSPVSGNVLTNDTDADGNALTISGYNIAGLTGSFTIGTPATIPNVGTILVNADGSFTFTPVENYNGTVPVITYMVSDVNGGTDTGDLAITVTSVNDMPVDTDGDGVTDDQELLDGTDPNDPCEFNVESKTLSTSTTWNDLDCDGDGETNATELANSTSITDPCSFTTAPAINSLAYSTWSGLDCDGDGLTNGNEISIGTDPLNPDSDGDGIKTIQILIHFNQPQTMTK